MDVIQPYLANSNWGVVKEPRGFMKCLQFLFTICAFATTTSFFSTFSFVVKCANGTALSTVRGVVQYDFSLDQMELTQEVCGKDEAIRVFGNMSSDSQFFVAIGVLSWLFVIAAAVLYTVFHATYSGNQLIPLLDCGMHVVLSVLWLSAASAWANSLRGLKSATSYDTLVSENPLLCGAEGEMCEAGQSPNYSKLDISVIFGFLNMFLFVSNIWFLYKETSFFRGPAPPGPPQEGVTPAAQWPEGSTA